MKVVRIAPEPFVEPRGTPISGCSGAWPHPAEVHCRSGDLPRRNILVTMAGPVKGGSESTGQRFEALPRIH
jgi:hypothetical protein